MGGSESLRGCLGDDRQLFHVNTNTKRRVITHTHTHAIFHVTFTLYGAATYSGEREVTSMSRILVLV